MRSVATTRVVAVMLEFEDPSAIATPDSSTAALPVAAGSDAIASTAHRARGSALRLFDATSTGRGG
jgi:hypothetical protein